MRTIDDSLPVVLTATIEIPITRCMSPYAIFAGAVPVFLSTASIRQNAAKRCAVLTPGDAIGVNTCRRRLATRHRIPISLPPARHFRPTPVSPR